MYVCVCVYIYICIHIYIYICVYIYIYIYISVVRRVILCIWIRGIWDPRFLNSASWNYESWPHTHGTSSLPILRWPDQQGNPHIREIRILAPVRLRMLAAGLQCLKLQIAVASPDPQTRAFPVTKLSWKTRSPNLPSLARPRSGDHKLRNAALAEAAKRKQEAERNERDVETAKWKAAETDVTTILSFRDLAAAACQRSFQTRSRTLWLRRRDNNRQSYSQALCLCSKPALS